MSTSSPIVPTTASIYETLDRLTTLQRQAIVRPTNPPPGIAGYLFDIPEEEELELRSEITDHYTEDNVAIQDHIALTPEEFTVRGIVAELVDYRQSPNARPAPQSNPLPINAELAPLPRPAQAQQFVDSQTLANVLAPGQAQTPATAQALGMTVTQVNAQTNAQATQAQVGFGLSDEQSEAVAKAQALMAASKSGAEPTVSDAQVAPAFGQLPASLYDFFLGSSGTPQSRQSQTVFYLYELWRGRQVFTVETPWGYFTDMAILYVRVIQEPDSRYKTNVAVTFKKIRTAGAAVVAAGQLAGRAAAQSAPTTQNGTAGQKDVSETEKESLLYSWIHGGNP